MLYYIVYTRNEKEWNCQKLVRLISSDGELSPRGMIPRTGSAVSEGGAVVKLFERFWLAELLRLRYRISVDMII